MIFVIFLSCCKLDTYFYENKFLYEHCKKFRCRGRSKEGFLFKIKNLITTFRENGNLSHQKDEPLCVKKLIKSKKFSSMKIFGYFQIFQYRYTLTCSVLQSWHTFLISPQNQKFFKFYNLFEKSKKKKIGRYANQDQIRTKCQHIRFFLTIRRHICS